MLDTSTEREWLLEADARQVVNHVQKLRKRAKLQPADPIALLFYVSGGNSTPTTAAAGEQVTKGSNKKGGKQQQAAGAKEGKTADGVTLDETLTLFGDFIHQTLLQPLYCIAKPLQNDLSNLLISESYQVRFYFASYGYLGLFYCTICTTISHNGYITL